MRRALLVVVVLLSACKPLDLEPVAPYAYAVYDPGSRRIPTPNQALVDDEAGHIDLSTDGADLTSAEVAMREWLNTLDGWSTATAGKIEFSEPIDPITATSSTLQVWEWGTEPVLTSGTTIEVSEDGQTVEILPPRQGWDRGGTYMVTARGGEDGLRTADGGAIGPDAAFWYLRLDEPLDTHPRAFSGDTRADRQDTADRMEALRQTLQPYFAHTDGAGVPRDDIIALWEFHTTTRVEVAMDSDSQRVPLPFDMLIDPATGLVDLTPADHDTELEADAKLVANQMSGFGITANPFFELTGPVDPATVTSDTVRLYDVAQTGEQVEAEIVLMAGDGPTLCEAAPVDEDCRFLFAILDGDVLPLAAARTYAMVVTEGLLDLEGRPVVPMPMGAMLGLPMPIWADGERTIGSLEDDDAVRLEGVRSSQATLLDALGRDSVTVAWPFTTMDAVPDLRETLVLGELTGKHPTPTVDSRKPAWRLIGTDHALADLFPGLGNPGPDVYIGRVDGVAEVVQGTIDMPYFLDPGTRRWNEGDAYEMRPIHYLATIPEDPPAGPLKVVVFGHAVVTDRRFLLTISGRLAREGFAAVAIDFPFHGERIECVDASLVATPNFLPEELQDLTGLTDALLYFPPCVSGDDATCGPAGECLDADGNVEDFSTFPIIDMAPVAGAALLDVSDIAHIPDHVRQALVDLGTLSYSLRTEPMWDAVFGQTIERESFHYAGQSLGSIFGSLYVALDPAVDRAVLNVAGANYVDLFLDSSFFSPQVDAVMLQNELEPGSFESERMLQVATWLLDAVDPLAVAHLYVEDERDAMIQIDRINSESGDLIIPNHTTETLQRASGLPMIAYPSILHADLIVPGLGDAMLVDLADFLAGDLEP
ncbi:MAG: hypothetical protein GY898_25575 [Proteobacteria bacterium]|nr:hypothetical protein [Pseudomonadota bacterium]